MLQCVDVYHRFIDDPDILSFAVVKAGRPIGIVNRHEFLVALSHLFGRSLYDRKPITSLMDDAPLIVDVNEALSDLNNRIVTEKPSALLKGFIVTEEGEYLGVGTALSLLQFTIEHMQARATELQQARHAAEEAYRTKSHFLANMSHELRTPLNAILGFSEIIKDEALGKLPNGRYREYAQDINESGRHLLQLINDVLDMAKIEAGKVKLSEAALNLYDVVGHSTRFVLTDAEKKNIALRTDVPEDLPQITADELKLKQVLVNLLANAVKFTPAGGAISVRAALTPIGDLELSVADTGIGMTPDEITLALEPFEQARGGFERAGDGTGLGLPLAQALVEAHGGSLSIESTVGAGTRVVVTLPEYRVLRDADSGDWEGETVWNTVAEMVHKRIQS